MKNCKGSVDCVRIIKASLEIKHLLGLRGKQIYWFIEQSFRDAHKCWVFLNG